jgi:hypothetical protein
MLRRSNRRSGSGSRHCSRDLSAGVDIVRKVGEPMARNRLRLGLYISASRVSVAVKNGAILAGPAWRPGRFAFGLFPAEVALVSQVAGAPTCQPGDVSAPTTSARVVLVVLPKWPLRALPLTEGPMRYAKIRNQRPRRLLIMGVDRPISRSWHPQRIADQARTISTGIRKQEESPTTLRQRCDGESRST